MAQGRWGIIHQKYDWLQCRYCGTARPDGGFCEAATCLACGSVQCKRKSECAVCLYGRVPGFYRTGGTPLCGYAKCGKEAVASAPRVRWVCGYHLARPTLAGYGKPKITLADYIAERVAERDDPRPLPYPRPVLFRWMEP